MPSKQLDRFEAFCCIQVERVQRTLDSRYKPGGARGHLMPRNDHFTRVTLTRDAIIETRGTIGYQGAKCGAQS